MRFWYRKNSRVPPLNSLNCVISDNRNKNWFEFHLPIFYQLFIKPDVSIQLTTILPRNVIIYRCFFVLALKLEQINFCFEFKQPVQIASELAHRCKNTFHSQLIWLLYTDISDNQYTWKHWTVWIKWRTNNEPFKFQLIRKKVHTQSPRAVKRFNKKINLTNIVNTFINSW